MTRNALFAGLVLAGLAAVANAQPAGRGPRCGVFEESHGSITVTSSGTQFSIPQLTSEGRFRGVGPGFGCWVEIGTSDDLRGTFVYGYRVTDPSGESKEFGPSGIEIGGSGSTGGIPVPAYRKPAGVWRVEFYTVRRDNAARAALGSVSFTMTDSAVSPTPPTLPPAGPGKQTLGSVFDPLSKTPPVKPVPPTPVSRGSASGVLFEDRFARPDAETPGAGWTEYILRGDVARQQDSPWRISGNTLRYEATGRAIYWEDFVETPATFPLDNVRVEFELRGQVSTSKGYVGPSVFLSGEGRDRATAQNVSRGPKQIGAAAWYPWDNQGTRGVIVVANGLLHDQADAVFAGVNQPAFAKHVLTIRNGTLTYEAPGFAVSYPVSVAAGERRHLTFGVRLYDSGVPQVVEIRNVKVTALGTETTVAGGDKSVPATGTVLIRQSVPASGGRIEVQRPGDPLNGLTIDVPAGAYTDARQFTVSSRPSPIDAATPLITVDNGGGYAATPMTVRIPLKIEPDQFAMGFFYDEGTGKLEGMPVLDENANSVTVATRHFSTFVVLMALTATLPLQIDTGFRPGIDDWQMVNRGSVIAHGGHCAGQDLSAMWYFYEKKRKGAPSLYGLYDHNAPGFRTHPSTKTPAFWQDDSLALRLVSTVQSDLDGSSWWRQQGQWMAEKGHDALTYNAFRMSMRVTGEPQYVSVWGYVGNEREGHALIAYKIADSKIYVADPNYPGGRDGRGRIVDRFIEYTEQGGFRPFSVSATAGAPASPFPNTGYVAKTALVDWGALGRRWDEFSQSFSMLPSEDEKLIGHDRFPRYQLALSTEGFKAGTNQPMADDMTIDQPEVEVRAQGSMPLKVSVIQDGRTIAAVPGGKIALKSGRNSLGFLVETEAGGDWVDYKDYNIWVGEAPPPEGNVCAAVLVTAAGVGLSPTGYYRALRRQAARDNKVDPDIVHCHCPPDVSDEELLACLQGR